MYSGYFQGFEKGIFSNIDPAKVEEVLGGIFFPQDNSVILYTDRFRDMLANKALRVDFLNNLSQSILSRTEWSDEDRVGLTATIFVMGKALTDIVYNSVPLSVGPIEQLKGVLEKGANLSLEIRKALETNLVGILPETTLNLINPLSLALRKGQEKYYMAVEDFLVKSNYYGRIMNLGKYLAFLRKKAEIPSNSKWARPEGYSLEYALLDSIADDYYSKKYGDAEHYRRPFLEVDFFHYLCENWPTKKKFGAKMMVARNFKTYTPFPVLFGYYIKDEIDDAQELINDFDNYAYERSENVGKLLKDVAFSESLVRVLEKKEVSIVSESGPHSFSDRKDLYYQDISWPPLLKKRYELMVADEEEIREKKILKEKLANLKKEGYFELVRNFAYIEFTYDSVVSSDRETNVTIFYNPTSDMFALSTEEDRFNLLRDSNTRDYLPEPGSDNPVLKIHRVVINDRIFIKADKAVVEDNASVNGEEDIDYYETSLSGGPLLDEFESDEQLEEEAGDSFSVQNASANEGKPEPDDIFAGSEFSEDENDSVTEEDGFESALIRSEDQDRIVSDILDDDETVGDGFSVAEFSFPCFIDISDFLEKDVSPLKKHFNGPLRINEPFGFSVAGCSFSIKAKLADRPGIYRITINGLSEGAPNYFDLDENDSINYAVSKVVEVKENIFVYITCSTASDEPSTLITLSVAEYG